MSFVRIGTGAGFSGDRIEPAIDLAKRGKLNYLVFECLAERTIALAQLRRLEDPNKGYDPYLEKRMGSVLRLCNENGTKIITNMGAANPFQAARETAKIAVDLGLTGLRIATVSGDDVMSIVGNLNLKETGKPAKELGHRLVSANAYLGIDGIIDALSNDADVVICGRVSDTSLFLAPIVHHFGWDRSDYKRLGRGTLIGHLIECAGQITGGYYADPGVKDVPDLVRIGYPIAEVQEDGNATITKLVDSGGLINRAICTEQLLYEIHDPSQYIQPDVIADFSNVQLDELAENQVFVSNGTGTAPTGQIKVSVGYLDGWIGEGQISYAGPNCEVRGRLAIELVQERLKNIAGTEIIEEHSSLIGIDSIYQGNRTNKPREVRMRYAAHCSSKEAAECVGFEVESLYVNGPAGGGGISKDVRMILGMDSTLLPSSQVSANVDIIEV